MRSRREFLKDVAGSSAGALLMGEESFIHAAYRLPQVAPPAGAPLQGAASGAAKRREIKVGGKRVKTVDAHCHVGIPGAADFFKGTPLGNATAEAAARGGGAEMTMLGPGRLALMDQEGIDVEAVSINAFWYSAADRDLVTRFIDFQNQKLAAMCAAANPDRFVGYASVALQFPELAAQQLEEGMKKYGLRGAAIGASVNGDELSNPRFDPFWAKAEELQALILIHPQDAANATGIAKRTQGNGFLGNVIANPLETALALAHLIMEGTLDKFPDLKLLAAHGGGFLPSYIDRLDHGCPSLPSQCTAGMPKKKPSEYMRQIYVDSLVFSSEALRHLAAVCGAGHIGIGTDYPFSWTTTPCDHILETPGLSDEDKRAMLGGTLCKLLRIPA